MKKRTFLISIFTIVAFLAGAQVPQKFNYQAIVRNSQNEVLSTQMVGFKMSVLKGSTGGSVVYAESHDITTSPIGVAELVIGSGGVLSGNFSDINWGDDLYFLKVEVDPAGGTSYVHLGTTQLISVPYALYSANVSSPTRKFSIQEEQGHTSDSALFEVKNKEGQTVFAVYPEGTRVYILDDANKGVKGGFAVGGYRRSIKGVTNEYLRITPDSIRLYISETSAKGVKGGFAVGGYRRSVKGLTRDYLNISGQETAEVIPGENRLVWYPQRNALLVGNVLVESADSVGENSMATGYQSKAIGNYSEAFGHRSIARGDYSTAIGNNATAYALNSVSIGNHSRAEETSSFALGTGAIALGVNSYAIGSSGIDSDGLPTGNTMALGEQSFALGMGSVAEGLGSFSIGTGNQSIGSYSIAMGYATQATDAFSTAMGYLTSASGSVSTAMGADAVASGNLSTAMGAGTVASGITSTAMGRRTDASGNYSTAMGYETVASGSKSTTLGDRTAASGAVSTATGEETTASGDYSTAMGWASEASGETSTTMGFLTKASGDKSTAMGFYTKASGDYSTAMGYYPEASGNSSTAMGFETKATSYCSLVIGKHNDTLTTSSPTSWISEDPLFIIGNGTAYNALHNAMLVKKNGEVFFPDVYFDAVSSGRDLYIANDGKIGYLSSSRRYKSNITLMDDVEWLYDLRPVNFVYKTDESETKKYGLIAEEVEEVNPLFVSYNEKGDPETVSYSQLVSPMIKAIQEQQELIEELQARIEVLENN